MSAAMVAAGVGWVRLEPPNEATMSTPIEPITPRPKPSSKPAGAIQTRNGGGFSADLGVGRIQLGRRCRRGWDARHDLQRG